MNAKQIAKLVVRNLLGLAIAGAGIVYGWKSLGNPTAWSVVLALGAIVLGAGISLGFELYDGISASRDGVEFETDEGDGECSE